MLHETTGNDMELSTQKHRNLKRIYKLRVYFYIPPLLVMTFYFWNEYENDLITLLFGPFLLGLCLVIRIWATKHIGRRISRKYKNGRILHLVTTGPYSLVRNPLYIGNILAVMGLCVLSELFWFMPMVFAYFILLYSLVVRYEEYKLSVLFRREYEIYCQKVPRWIPRFSMYQRPKEEGFTWTKALRGELPGVASSFVMILILLGKEIIGW